MRKVIISGMVGNALEWYDYALYSHVAAVIGKLFFPNTDPYLALLATYSIFAAGFIMRPVGGVFFGYIGDKFGRKTALSLSVLMMAVPTTIMGLLPSYAQIGVLAPILLIIMRLIQGLALGGEFSGCISFVVEHAPTSQRGLAGSSSMFSMCAGILMGLGVATLTSHIVGHENFELWGWRIPFVISLFIGVIGLYIRNKLHESPTYIKAKKEGNISKLPVREVFSTHLKELILATSIYFTVTVPFYTLTVFMTGFTYKIVGFSLATSMRMNTISILILMLVLPFFAYISDKVGRKPVLIASASAFVLLAYPIFNWICSGDYTKALMGQILFGIILSAYIAPVPATLVELFPTRVRFTGVALSYNISAALFGGTTPFVATWLIKRTMMNNSLAFYIIMFAIFTLIALYHFQDRYKEPLR
jgi:MHS family proline/betaine transporter-like MFS transporter